ncbi:MAG TPA: histidine kinase [Mucilaginibacter sp.]|nr:histidine kinase [Mucilaginibacter sp.]
MKVIIKPRHINITLHVLIWGVLLLLPYFVSTAASGYKIGSIPGLFFTEAGIIHMAIFYINVFYLYPRFYNRRFWFLYILSCILLVFGSFWLKYHIMAAWFPEIISDASVYKFVFPPSIAVFIISIIYCRIVDSISFEREQKEKQAAQLLTELKFLRSQISPHFLFNVLTNLVSLARKKSDKLEQSLIMLSDLMRYMLYDAQGKKVALQKEIEYLSSYIELQKLRFGSDVQVNSRIELDNEDDQCTIEPMLLIPFVENAFKHGVGYNEQPQIDIELSVYQGLMIFEVRNKFEDEPLVNKDESSGIGLSNVRSRLNLLYKDSYTLTINDQNNLFGITLTLKLV